MNIAFIEKKGQKINFFKILLDGELIGYFWKEGNKIYARAKMWKRTKTFKKIESLKRNIQKTIENLNVV